MYQPDYSSKAPNHNETPAPTTTPIPAPAAAPVVVPAPVPAPAPLVVQIPTAVKPTVVRPNEPAAETLKPDKENTESPELSPDEQSDDNNDNNGAKERQTRSSPRTKHSTNKVSLVTYQTDLG